MLGDKVLVEADGDVVRSMPLTPENIQRFWDKAKEFDTLFGKELNGSVEEFTDLFLSDGNVGLFFVLNDFDGVFYLTDIAPEEDALAHYSFFDRKHNGRVELVKKMIKFIFNRYRFNRLSVQIPNYATPQARHFVQKLGFAYEGKRRKAAMYKGELYDINLYGILHTEVQDG